MQYDDQQIQIEKQQKEIESQQLIIRNAQLDVATQQANITNQNERISSLQKVLVTAQTNLDKITAAMVKQQARIDDHQKDLESQQVKIYQAQTDLGKQQTALTNQFEQMFEMQNELAVAQTNISKQQRKIEDVETLINGLYSRTVVERFSASDSDRVVIQDLGKTTRVFFKLKYVPVENSVEGIEQIQTRIGPFSALFGIIFPVNEVTSQMPVTGLSSTNNISFTYYGGGKGSISKGDVFVLKYTRDEHATNLIKKVEIKDKKVFLDGQRYIWPPDSERP